MDKLKRLDETYGFTAKSGFIQTYLEPVHLLWSTGHVDRTPLLYDTGFVLILQGTKTGFLADQTFEYKPGQYIVLSVPVPFDCEVTGTKKEPLICLFINIDRTELHELVSLVDGETPPPAGPTNTLPLGLAPADLTGTMREATGRLLDALCSSTTSKALGKGIVREILFHALSERHGGALRELTKAGSHYGRIAKTIAFMRRRYAETLTIDMLAAEAGMSAPTFHRVFKSITGSSPLQHIKATRLQRARDLLVTEKLPVGHVARQVGYDNAAHFSREFKKYFGVSPKHARAWG